MGTKDTAGILDRYVQTVYPSREHAEKRFQSGEKLTFYLGIDPTGPHIHLGHSTNLLWLKKLQSLGHEVILLIGDFTARVGDPSDKTAARTALTSEEVEENMKTYLEQVEQILAPGTFSVRYNSEWLSPLTFEEVIRLASSVTVQQVIQRDMFQERLKQGKPIYLHEFLYPLMQGYDSVAMRVDGEVGGNDQTFNMLMGRALEEKLINKDKLVITTSLLEDPETKEKIMNKSKGTAIFLDDSPQEMRRKILALDDRLIRFVFELCTEAPMDSMQKMLAEKPRDQKEALAAEHGEDAVAQAGEAIEVHQTGQLDAVLKDAGLAASLSEAKRLIEQKAIEVNGETVTDWHYILKAGDTLRVGKGRFAKII